MVLKIASMKLPALTDGEDYVYWGCSKTRFFTVKSAFNLIEGPKWDMEETKWNLIWNWKGPERVKVFLWLAMHDRLLTNVERVRRRLTYTDICEKCHLENENTIHVLRDCPFATWIWMNKVKQVDWEKFFNLPLQEWLSNNLCNRKSMDGAFHWSLSFGVTCWVLSN